MLIHKEFNKFNQGEIDINLIYQVYRVEGIKMFNQDKELNLIYVITKEIN